jgi:DTW domain-containing protein YfiP
MMYHHKEFFNAANTGKILFSSAPRADLFIGAIPEDEKRLAEIVAADAVNSLVLFPSGDSITVQDFEKERKEKGVAAGHPVNIVALDGTWGQAKHLHARLMRLPEFANVRKVRLAPEQLSKFMSRKQSQVDRICTVEAVALLLKELGEPPDVQAALERGLEMITDVNTKSGRHPRKPVEFGNLGQRVNRTSGFKRQVLRQQQGAAAAGSKNTSEGSEEEDEVETAGQASDVSLPPPDKT